MKRSLLRKKIFAPFSKNMLLIAGASIVLFFIIVAVFAPLIATHNPAETNLQTIFLPPSAEHYFGTDEIGRDVFSRVVYGTRISLFVGFIAVGISLIIGVTLVNVMVVIGLTGWMGVARLVRAEVMSVKNREYITAAILQGLSHKRIMFKHILPNVLSPVFVTATLSIAGAILLESSLSFLGLGVQPPAASWGNILTDGQNNIITAWWLSLFPGLAIVFTALGYNLLGEGLRDVLDPKNKKDSD